MNDIQPEMIIDGLLYRSSTHLLTGDAKSGKSYLAYQLAMCLASGKDFLGMSGRQARVLLIAPEMTKGMIRERMQDIERDTGIPFPTHEWFSIDAPTREDGSMVDHYNLTTSAGLRTLRSVIERSNAEVVILDTLYCFTPGKDESRNVDMAGVMRNLNKAATDSQAAFVILDHTRKRLDADGPDGPVSHSAIGAQSKGGASRVIIALKRTSQQGAWGWTLRLEGHFGCWENPIYTRRPKSQNGYDYGFGFERVDAASALKLTPVALEELFERNGIRDREGNYYIASQNKLSMALIKEEWVAGKDKAGEVIRAIRDKYCVPYDPTPGRNRDDPTRPILTRSEPNRAVSFTWRGSLLV